MPRLLIVDDDKRVRQMLRQMLEFEGYHIAEAANGEQAVHVYRSDPCDVVILDIIMPVKEGIATLTELQKVNPEVKIIAISGGDRFAPQGYLETAELAGAQFTFSKPVDRKELLNAIRSLLGEPPASD